MKRQHYIKKDVVACADCGRIETDRDRIGVMTTRPARTFAVRHSWVTKPVYTVECASCPPVMINIRFVMDDGHGNTVDDIEAMELINGPNPWHDAIIVDPANP